MMFGYRDKFIYFQCPVCECLQISEVPADISKYYPSDYLSFHTPSLQIFKNSIKGRIRKVRNNYAYYNKGILGKLIYKFYPVEVLKTVSRVKLNKDQNILDVGSGTGALLSDMKELGFNNLLGIDPFIEKDIEYENKLKILKKSIHEIEGKWDLIMFHHSFEHISDPLETLQSVSKRLEEDGTCLIRVPTVSSYAWENYKENWVQLDAPRHYFLHSIKSITLLAEKANLAVEKIIYDSSDFQFWGSEQYIKNIPLTDSHSRFINTSNSIFSRKEIASFKQKAEELNRENKGDTIAVFLKRNKIIKRS
ncbi:MAG: class I SAM-dependent methyltransferase [Paludibacteraceae bacterium]